MAFVLRQLGRAAHHSSGIRAAAGVSQSVFSGARCTASLRLTVLLQGSEHEVHPLWLRLNDPGQVTLNGQRLFEIKDIVENAARCARVDQSCHNDSSGLRVLWGDGHTSVFPWAWLESQLRAHDELEPLPVCWDRSALEPQRGGKLPEIEYQELWQAEGKLRVSAYLVIYGLAVVRSVPMEEGMVSVVGNQLGHVRVTNYGSIFDVVDKGEAAENLAYTSRSIGAHTDNPYRDPFPGVQMLHCLSSSAEGGATLFTDGFQAAEELRREDSTSFRLLASTAHPFEYRDAASGVLLRADAPVITLRPYRGGDRVERIAFNNRSASVWQGPMDEIDAYYRAWAKFDVLCNSDELQLPVKLQPGDLAIWLNGRVLHGRQAYGGGRRHLQGAYIDHDELWSRVYAAKAAGDDLRRFVL